MQNNTVKAIPGFKAANYSSTKTGNTNEIFKIHVWIDGNHVEDIQVAEIKWYPPLSRIKFERRLILLRKWIETHYSQALKNMLL